MKKFVVYVALLMTLFVGLSLLISGPAANAQGGTPIVPHLFPDAAPADWPDEPGAMPELSGGRIPDRPVVFIDKSTIESPQAGDATTIDVWYGPSQKFGQLGNPQEWINILGNVSDPVGIKSLTYQLNGGDETPLSIGTANKRLINPGDFNIEIAYADLNNGTNTVVIKATNDDDQVTTTNVTVTYTAGVTWASTYTADWSSSSDIQDIAQVVDGDWSLQGGNVIPLDVGYDRLIAIGDETWTDYEVTMPFTVKAIDAEGFTRGGPGIGLILHWLGHNQTEGQPPEQPLLDWARVGGIGWYKWSSTGIEGLELRGRNWNRGYDSDVVLDFDVPYVLKMSVQASSVSGDDRSYYRLKLWPAAEAEPFEWNLQAWSDATAEKNGSVVLVAHYVDVEIGNVQINNLDDLTFTVTATANGSGSTGVEPPGVTEFTYGERAIIRAIPASGYALDSWSGDIVSSANPLIVFMTKDLYVTANFVVAPPGMLTVNVNGKGSVTRSPDKPLYDGGEEVVLMANPEPGYRFVEWSGHLTGTQNPAVIQISGDKTVTATFEPTNVAAPYSDGFDRGELNTDLWTVVNPSGDGSVIVEDGLAKLTVPAGAAHTLYKENRDAVRIMQTAENEDFLLETKFDSIPASAFQIEGMLIEQDNDNWLRFDFYHDGSQVIFFSGSTIGGVWQSEDSIPMDVSGASALYLRVSRSGDIWTPSYSLNGSDWQLMESFVQPLLVSKAGVFVGNEPNNTAPGFTALVDYFKNMSYPEGVLTFLPVVIRN
ncbi:MAG: InlB B-repeat-containing protein [Candidatus Promineifilaceae bacterium]|jgi:regulation of enolase protein 1 (concanavalin A-like superfamily)